MSEHMPATGIMDVATYYTNARVGHFTRDRKRKLL